MKSVHWVPSDKRALLTLLPLPSYFPWKSQWAVTPLCGGLCTRSTLKRGLSPNYLLDSQVGGWLMTQLAALKEESSIQISMLLSFFNLKWV